MNRRVVIATRLALVDQARRPLLAVLLVVLPPFFISRAIARTEPTPRIIGLPGGDQFLTTMRDVHGASMVTITVAFLAALCGTFIMQSAREGDRRLVVAGFRPHEAILPRVVVLGVATLTILAVSLAVTAISFDAKSWFVFAVGNLLAALTYACIGALAGALLSQLAATYLVLFLAMLGTGIVQNPMFGDGTPGPIAALLPDYGAFRVVIDGAFSSTFHAWVALGAALTWLAALALATAWCLLRALRT